MVYILKNSENKIYIGQTSDLSRRLEEHNFTGVGYTSKHRPWVLVHTEEFKTRSKAMSREKYFKTGKGRIKIKEIIVGA
jgi:putative endonuclease